MSDIRWSGDAGPKPDDAVENVLAACLEREPAERAGAFERACSTHPELATDLRQRWSALAAMGFVDTSAADTRAADTGAARVEEPQFPEQLGDFRLVRRLGGGGMGVVYLARQISLGRDVALKLVRPEQLFFPRAKERFRREAEAIAKLGHPGIVPIHTVGEEHGVPFFAMEWIRGCTLAEALASLAGRAPESLTGRDLERAIRAAAGVPEHVEPHPLFAASWVDTCLALARQVADALEHAHGRGLIHRDVKPSNVMVTPDGRARLVDFGLTAVTEVASTTRTGAQLGTLHYMAPEQVRASKDVDVRADVYGLGVTLYELLSLQLPYRGDDALEVQRAILEGRADSLRARNRSVSSDVETVCAVAMERDPARRYASAGAFAHDLFNLLERRPIAARPPGAWVRVARFAQRRPALTTSLAAALVLAIATPSALLWQSKRHGRELADRASMLELALGNERDARHEADEQRSAARTAEARALEQKTKAVDNAAAVEASLDFMIEMFHESAPQTSLGREITAREVLERGAAQIESGLADRPAARARLQAGIGEVFFELGRYASARDLLQPACETFEQLQDPALDAAAERAASNLTVVYQRMGDLEQAEELARKTLDRARERVETDPERFVFALNHLAVVLASLGRADEAQATSMEVVEFLETHEVPHRRENLAANLAMLAQTHLLLGDANRARETAEHALALQREILPPVHPELHMTLGTLGYIHKMRGEFAQADERYSEAACVMDALGIDRGFDYANTLHNWASLKIDRGEFEAALAIFDLAQALDARTDGTTGRVSRMCSYGYGRVAFAAERWSAALGAFEDAALRFLAGGVAEERHTALGSFYRAAVSAVHLERREVALADFGRSLELAVSLAGREEDAVRIASAMADIEVELGRSREARDALALALELASAEPRLAGSADALRAKLAALPGQ